MKGPVGNSRLDLFCVQPAPLTPLTPLEFALTNCAFRQIVQSGYRQEIDFIKK